MTSPTENTPLVNTREPAAAPASLAEHATPLRDDTMPSPQPQAKSPCAPLAEADDKVEDDTGEDVMNKLSQTGLLPSSGKSRGHGMDTRGEYELSRYRSVFEKRLKEQRVAKELFRPIDDLYADAGEVDVSYNESSDQVKITGVKASQESFDMNLADRHAAQAKTSNAMSRMTVGQTAFKAKDGSPYKRRRKAAGPEEMAELVRETQLTREHLAKCQEEQKQVIENLWTLYSGKNLTPSDAVMQTNTAEDLITFSAPVKTHNASLSPLSAPAQGVGQDFENATKNESQTPKANSPIKDTAKTKLDINASSPVRSTVLAPQLSMTPIKTANNAVHETQQGLFGSDTIGKQDANQVKAQAQEQAHVQAQAQQEHPPFIEIIYMLPMTLFWVTAAPIVKWASEAQDVLLQWITGLA